MTDLASNQDFLSVKLGNISDAGGHTPADVGNVLPIASIPDIMAYRQDCLERTVLFWDALRQRGSRSEEHTSELQSLMRISYAVFCLKKKIYNIYAKVYI